MFQILLGFGWLALFVFAFTRARILVLCFYYFSFGVLTVVNDQTAPLLGGLNLYRPAYPILLLVVLVALVRDPWLAERCQRWPNLSFMAVLLTLMVSSFYSTYSGALTVSDPGGVVTFMVVMLLFWIAAAHMGNPRDFEAFVWTTVGLSVVLSCWVIWTAAEGNFLAFRGGTNVNENYESMFVCAGIIPLVQFILSCPRWSQRLMGSAAILLILCASAVLASRSVVLAVAVGAATTGCPILWGLPRRTLLGFGLLLCLIIGFVLLFPATRNLVSAFSASDLSTLDDRTVIWGYAWRHFIGLGFVKTLFGEGLSSGTTVLGSFFTEYSNYHSAYLMWLMERGWVGLAVFLVFQYRVGRALFTSRHPLRHMMRGWFVFLLTIGIGATVANEHFYWILLGVMVGAAAQYESPAAGGQRVSAVNRLAPANG